MVTQIGIVFVLKNLYIVSGLNSLGNRFFEWRNRTTESNFLLSPLVAPFELIKSSFLHRRTSKNFAFFLLRADSLGGAAGDPLRRIEEGHLGV